MLHSGNRNQAGLTLIELMITLVVGSLLLVIAVPSFMSFQKDNRRITQLNELVSGLNLARSEAVKSNAVVALCPSSDQVSCSGVIYDNGWVVFLNTDGDSPPVVDGGETILRAHTGTSSGATLRASGITTGLNFLATGRPNTGGDITYCDDRGADKARAVIVSIAGIIRTSELHADGSALSCP
ncbi:MAG: GspH/FimT family pseudopilin [Pseudomonadota bacterium]